MTQREYQGTGASLSQCAMILALLQQEQGNWVSSEALGAESGSMAVCVRVAELRQRGHRIECKGRPGASYRLLPAEEVAP